MRFPLFPSLLLLPWKVTVSVVMEMLMILVGLFQ